jgi:hypothetical protein
MLTLKKKKRKKILHIFYLKNVVVVYLEKLVESISKYKLLKHKYVQYIKLSPRIMYVEYMGVADIQYSPISLCDDIYFVCIYNSRDRDIIVGTRNSYMSKGQ